MRAAASNDFEGTQPKFRQSPPIAPRSTSTTSAPICAAPAATASPPDPAPMTQRSGAKCRSCGLVGAPALVAHRDQREDHEPDDRTEHARPQQDRETGLPDDVAEAGTKAGIDKSARNDAEKGGQDKGRQPDPGQGWDEVDEPERDDEDEAQDQQVIER